MHRFFADQLPLVNAFVRREGHHVKALAPRINPFDLKLASSIGTAFDYRLRLHFGFEPAADHLLELGAERLVWVGSGLGDQADRTWHEAIQGVLQQSPVGDDDLLARACVVMGWLDAAYRSPRGLYTMVPKIP